MLPARAATIYSGDAAGPRLAARQSRRVARPKDRSHSGTVQQARTLKRRHMAPTDAKQPWERETLSEVCDQGQRINPLDSSIGLARRGQLTAPSPSQLAVSAFDAIACRDHAERQILPA
jgi:hypothetical protein